MNHVQTATEEPVGAPGAPDYPLEELLLAVGLQVRRYRQLRGMTLQDVAAATGLSASMISTVERGQTGVSLATVHALARSLDVSITDLFRAEGPGDPVTRANEQRRDRTTGGADRTLVITDPAQRIELYRYDFAPGTASADAPTSHRGVEYGIVIDGSLVVQLDGVDHVLHAGDAVQYVTRQRHLMRNDAAEHATVVWINASRM